VLFGTLNTQSRLAKFDEQHNCDLYPSIGLNGSAVDTTNEPSLTAAALAVASAHSSSSPAQDKLTQIASLATSTLTKLRQVLRFERAWHSQLNLVPE